MASRYCDHTFVVIKPMKDTDVYACVGCLYCGQIRNIDVLGNVTISVEEGKVEKKPKNDRQV